MTHSKTPSFGTLSAALDKGFSRDSYVGYYKRIFDYLYGLDDSEVATTDQIIEEAINTGPKASVSKSSKETRIRDVQIYDPTLSGKIIDKCPPGEVLLLLAENRTGVSIDSRTLNDIQRECMQIGDETADRYYDYLLDGYQDAATQELDITLSGMVGSDTVEELLEKFAFIVAGDLPQRITAMSNSLVGCGGTANELIGVRVLTEAGLAKGRDFARTGGNTNEDIIVYSNSAPDMEIEVKSSKARERTPRAIAEMSDPTAIFSFFDDPSEVRSQIISGTSLGSAWPENSVVAYVPPDTIQEVQSLDEIASDGRSIYSQTHPDTGDLYLRANNRFAEDMREYSQTGSLPSLSDGHHTEYL